MELFMKSALTSDTMIEEVGGIFAALGDHSRLKILQVLLEAQGRLNQTQIVERAGLTQANASKHLSCLVRVGLLTRIQEGNAVFYEPVLPLVGSLCQLVGNHVIHRAQTNFRALR
jgi:DNA-binding transcriptional ArsR family regulator